MGRICPSCNIDKDIEMFGKNRHKCKSCTRLALNIKSPDTTVKCTVCNEEKQYLYFAKRTNKCKSCKNKLEKEKRENDREKYNEIARTYVNANNEVINSKRRTREKIHRANDPLYRLRHNLSTRLYLAVSKKVGKTLELTGCSIDELKIYLESKFTKGMSWDNYGQWHVDHIRPCILYDLRDIDQQKECFHFSNLQPLWAKDNISKGSKYYS
jgi:hypothetical protein